MNNQLAYDKQRVKVLLETNTLLIHRAMLLEIAANPSLNTNNVPMTDLAPVLQILSNPTTNKNDLLNQYLSRVKANLTCIGELNERYKPGAARKMICPSLLNPPPEATPELQSRYALLAKMFAEALPYLKMKNSASVSPHNSQMGTPMSGSASLRASPMVLPATTNGQGQGQYNNYSRYNNGQYGQMMGGVQMNMNGQRAQGYQQGYNGAMQNMGNSMGQMDSGSMGMNMGNMGMGNMGNQNMNGMNNMGMGNMNSMAGMGMQMGQNGMQNSMGQNTMGQNSMAQNSMGQNSMGMQILGEGGLQNNIGMGLNGMW